MKVLLAEDEAIARLKMERLLSKWGYEVVSAKDGAAAWAILRSPDSPSLAILDWMMPKLDGVAVCRVARKRTGQPYTYIIMVTSRGGQEDAYAGIEAGVDDYLVKPVDPEYLRSRLTIAHKVLDLHEQLWIARDQLRVAGAIDDVSGLLDRDTIMTTLERELQRTRRAGTPVGVVMAEVDHFRTISETQGRPGAGAALAEVGRRLRTALRDSDSAGRLDAAEFLVVAPGCDPAQTVQLAERLRRCVSAGPIRVEFPEQEPVELSVTMSLGTFGAQRDADTDITAMLSDLQKAVQQAKRDGFDRVSQVGAPAKESLAPLVTA
jgi:two-component system, cell cycle response regulator